MKRTQLLRTFWFVVPAVLAVAITVLAAPPSPETGQLPLPPPTPEVQGWLPGVRGWLPAAPVESQSCPAAPVESQSCQPNLLVNGDFDQLPFYWRYPNHFVAGGWIRWWIHGTVLPEFDDARSRPRYAGGHAQVYHKWGDTYEAGIYQVVSGLIPCVPYRLTMWARNHSLEGVLPHAKIGLDPEGTQLTPSDDDCAVKTGLPPKTAWSREQTALSQWEELSVEAEPLGNRLTAILYAHPEPPNDGRTYYFDTIWDAGRLITATALQLPAPASWTPSEFITNIVTSTVLNTLVVEWKTQGTAASQVWYTIIPPASPPVSPTGVYTVYLLLVMRSPTYDRFTSVKIGTHHRAVIEGLQDGQTVRFVVAIRRLEDGNCVTEVSAPIEVTF